MLQEINLSSCLILSIYIILVTTSALKHHKDNKKKKWPVLLFKTCSL